MYTIHTLVTCYFTIVCHELYCHFSTGVEDSGSEQPTIPTAKCTQSRYAYRILLNQQRLTVLCLQSLKLSYKRLKAEYDRLRSQFRFCRKYSSPGLGCFRNYFPHHISKLCKVEMMQYDERSVRPMVFPSGTAETSAT